MPRKPKPKPVPPAHTYTVADALVLTSATESNLIHWTHIGTIKAAIPSAGRGYPQRFSPFNIIEIELAAVINRFKVPTRTIEGALSVFRSFHQGAVAINELQMGTDVLVDPPHLQLFKDSDHRRRIAEAMVRSHLYATTRGPATQEMSDRAVAQMRETARVWAAMRTGPLMRGVPDPSRTEFLGLIMNSGATEGDDDLVSASVELNPEIRKVVEGSAIIIDLATVLFRVGERFSRVSAQMGPW